jgi:hypothetical protein
MRCSALDVCVGLHLCIRVPLSDVGASLHLSMVCVPRGCTHLHLAVLTCDTGYLPFLSVFPLTSLTFLNLLQRGNAGIEPACNTNMI